MQAYIIILPVLLITCNATPFPPTDRSWIRSAQNPVLLPTEPWEETCVCEPQVFWDKHKHQFRMYYRGGWGHQAVGVATSENGVQWQKYLHNPIYGHGGSNISGYNEGGQPFVLFQESLQKYWLFTTAPSRMNIATSPDGYAWKTERSHIQLPTNCGLWGNRVVWIEDCVEENATTIQGIWYMLQEVMCGGIWNIFLYASSNGLVWHVGNHGRPLSSLQIGAGGGMYGGPDFANIGGTVTPRNASGMYNLWYHAAPEGRGVLPTDIYHASSTDLISWHKSLNGEPVLKHTGNGFEYDQVADPAPTVDPYGNIFLFYDGDNNRNGRAAIGMARSTPEWKPLHLSIEAVMELI